MFKIQQTSCQLTTSFKSTIMSWHYWKMEYVTDKKMTLVDKLDGKHKMT